jgi:FkbM family methyltransferase
MAIKDIRLRFVDMLVELNEQIIFNRRLLKYYRKSQKNKISFVLDIGANKGQTIDLFLKLNPECEVWAFEPNPMLADLLREKYALNKNIKIHQFGVSSEDGEKVFHENILNTTSTFEELDMKSKYLKTKSTVLGVKPEEIISKSYPVKVTSLSNFINANCTKTIDILKIDTEGHEYACLLGLFSQKLSVNVMSIQIEQHNDDMYLNATPFEKIISILKDNKYEISAKIPHGFGDFDELIFNKT